MAISQQDCVGVSQILLWKGSEGIVRKDRICPKNKSLRRPKQLKKGKKYLRFFKTRGAKNSILCFPYIFQEPFSIEGLSA